MLSKTNSLKMSLKTHINSNKKVILKDKIFIWQGAYFTLHTAQCTQQTAPAPSNSPESAPVQFIIQIEHCTLYTARHTIILNAAHLSHLTENVKHSPELHSRFTWQK